MYDLRVVVPVSQEATAIESGVSLYNIDGCRTYETLLTEFKTMGLKFKLPTAQVRSHTHRYDTVGLPNTPFSLVDLSM